ncbi:hypothetical protein PPTG_09895 [Phytophthora nicotianae INRA-310]|uniref:Peptidase M14 domain-containing protein n=1 Tax=Phytophthora nicotianae (strain INRA-310) TaxID=761204 RepID=W2QCG2_PHYN3|nr:hypothetical protein PPTG_09895 [Phytophthora nicotianae INRA-310]ETN10827.1 hypothetical protein PPTG_09895 [Phytophthora nicotianae INRA-310]
MSAILAIGIVVACISIPPPSSATVTIYGERSYGEIVDYLLELETKYQDYSEVFSVQDKYGLPKYSEVNCTRNNETVPCEQYVIKITDEETLPDPERPELIFSGSVHGNERVGPQVLVALAELLLSHASRTDGNPWLQHLVKTRTIVIVPTANAYGYNHNVRRELGVDPNRDFPYNLGDTKECMETTAARALNELWRDHLFQLGITFHAGRECITYEWGAKNHVKESGKSDKSPDNLSQQQLSRVMSRFGGKFEDSAQYYPDGTMNDVVYAVDGGMEDWGYAASWENEYTTPKPIKECNPSSFGGYPAEKTRYNNATHRAFNVLIEASNSKQPNATTWGDSSTLSDEALSDYLPEAEMAGHVPRNTRLSLLYIDLVQPYVLWKTHPYNCSNGLNIVCSCSREVYVGREQTLIVSFHFQTQILVIPSRNSTLRLRMGNTSRVIRPNFQLRLVHYDSPRYLPFERDSFVHIAFDQDWATQGTGEDIPVPKVKPQTHIVNARTNDDWLYSNNGRVVRGQTVWTSQTVKIVVT